MDTVDLSTEKILFNRQNGGELNVLNAFPNTYEIAMASLGFQTVFKLWASNPKTHTFRYFTNFSENPKMDKPGEVDILTLSISWELDFFNLFEILQKLNIPLKAKDRDSSHPIVIGGGPVLTANPEPWAEFFDLIIIGDSEDITDQIIDTAVKYKKWITTSPKAPRNDGLKFFNKLPGIYITQSTEQKEILRQKSTKEQLAVSSVLAPSACWDDVGLIEVVRSCPEMCRFCLASYLTLPFRAPEFESDLIKKANFLLEHTNNIGLLGASVTQHPEFMRLLEYLCEHPKKPRVQIASVRATTVTKEMCELLSSSGTKSLTIAIESGSERLREVVNKKLPEEAIFTAAKAAQEGGIKSLKLYGMVGIPHETDEDIDLTIDLLTRLKKANKTLKIVWGCSVFTPKAQTPFQDYGIDQSAEKKLKKIIKALRPLGIEVREESFKWAQVQALISRGDRTLADVFIKIWSSKKTGFGIYKKMLDPVDYKHFVFDDWSKLKNFKYPWQKLITEKQAEILKNHKEDALIKS
jgi:radical SAM superfamily enzyme YgiQ (UPF0313 family)